MAVLGVKIPKHRMLRLYDDGHAEGEKIYNTTSVMYCNHMQYCAILSPSSCQIEKK